MDKQVEALLLDHKGVAGKRRELTPEETERFSSVSWDGIHNQLLNLFPGETPIIERINPSDGTVIYHDSHGRRTAGLEFLGYVPVSNGKNFIYMSGKTIFQRLH